MAWENADKIFPLGYALLPDGSQINNDDLKKSKIKTLFQDVQDLAVDMVTRHQRYFWGDEEEFRIYTMYDVYNEVPCPDPDYHPLNVYGMRMLADYLKFNNIKIEQ